MQTADKKTRDGIASQLESLAKRIRTAENIPFTLTMDQGMPIEKIMGGHRRTGLFAFNCMLRMEYPPGELIIPDEEDNG